MRRPLRRQPLSAKLTNRFIAGALIGTLGMVVAYFFAPPDLGVFVAVLLAANVALEFYVARMALYARDYDLGQRLAALSVCLGGAILRIIIFFGYAYRSAGLRDTSLPVTAGATVNGPADCLYFSVITFTTVGYGDYVPVGVARLYAGFEALVGYFALALSIVLLTKFVERYFPQPR